MNITEIHDSNIIKRIVTNPLLFKLHGFAGFVEDYEPNLHNDDIWLHIIQDDKDIGLVQLEPITAITANSHVYILPEHHGSGIALEAVREVREYIKEKLRFKKIICTVPFDCGHVVKFNNKVGFTPCGLIHNGVIYNNRLQDLIIFEIEV